MTPEVQQILSDRHYKEIQKGLAACDKAETEITVAESCGEDMSGMRADLDVIRTQLRNYKSTYFPNKK